MDEVELLEAHSPLVTAPSPEVTRRAREHLMVSIYRESTPAATAPAPLRRRRRPRVALALATAAVIAGAIAIGVVPGHGPAHTEAAYALDLLSGVALHHAAPGAGTVAHTISIANWGDGETKRETWIAPNGSGRIKETGAGATLGDESFGVNGLSFTDFSAWPTDATSVLAKLRAEAKQADMRPVDAEAFVRAGDYLRETAAPPEVRAAIFAAVARLNGVRALSAVTDHSGRGGVGFEIDSDADHDSRWELIFDPNTSVLLGEREGSITHGYSAWSDYTVSELVSAVPSA